MAGKSVVQPPAAESEIRRIIVVCHGETVEKAFGPSWPKFYDDDGNLKCTRAFSMANYVSFEDGNLPISLMDRADGLKMYDRDTPLTEVGKITSLEVGFALGANGVKLSHIGNVVYCSPTCACVESAHFVCKGLALANNGGQPPADKDGKDGLSLRIENGFITQLGHDSRINARNMPKWLTADEIQAGLGRQVDVAYKPAVTDLIPATTETVDECYARMRKTVDKLLPSIPSKQNQTLLIVGHPQTLEAATRQLYNGSPRRQRDFDSLMRQIPFSFTVRVSEKSANTWQMTEPLVPALTYSANDIYRWEAFGDQNEMRKVLKK